MRAGGGLIHLVNLLRAGTPCAHGFSKVVVWAGNATLSRIEAQDWLVKSHQHLLDKSLLYRIFWQRAHLVALARSAGCDVLFVPGGSYSGSFSPAVTMSQNLLPFEWKELWRYGFSSTTFRLLVLRWAQTRTFRKADGVIFLTEFARDVVTHVVRKTRGETKIIPHGAEVGPAGLTRKQLRLSEYSTEQPFRLLYVSIVDLYKHQWHVVDAVTKLRKSGLPVVLDLVGPAYPPALSQLRKTMSRVDPTSVFIRYLGEVSHQDLYKYYAEADAFVFASTCETFGQVLLEAMSAGLPIACSNRYPMREIVSDAGIYFDPEDANDIARSLTELIDSPELRETLAKASTARVKMFSWERCASETFGFLSTIACGLPSILAPEQS